MCRRPGVTGSRRGLLKVGLTRVIALASPTGVNTPEHQVSLSGRLHVIRNGGTRLVLVDDRGTTRLVIDEGIDETAGGVLSIRPGPDNIK